MAEGILGDVVIESPFGASSAIMEMVNLGSPDATPEPAIDPAFKIGLTEEDVESGGNSKDKDPEEEVEEDADEEDDASPSDTEDDDTSEDEAEEDSEDDAEDDTPKLKATHKGKDIEIPLTATIPVKVNGKIKDIPISALTEDYSGKEVIKQHFAKSKQERAQFENEKAAFFAESEALEGKLKKATEQLKTNPFGALEALAEISGADESFFDVFVKQAVAVAKTIESMTPEQAAATMERRKLELARKRLDFEKEQINKVEQATTQQKAIAHQILIKQNELGVSESELGDAFNIVKDLEQAKGLDPLKMADLCFEYVFKVERPYAQVERVLPKVAPKGTQDPELVKAMVEIIRDEVLSDEEVGEIIKQYYKANRDKPKGRTPAETPKEAKAAAPKAKAPLKTSKKAETDEGEDEFDPTSIDDIRARFNAF